MICLKKTELQAFECENPHKKRSLLKQILKNKNSFFPAPVTTPAVIGGSSLVIFIRKFIVNVFASLKKYQVK